MKIVVRTMGSFLVATLAVALIFSLISYTLIPELSQYIKDTFPAEKNLELVSVVAADPDPEHAEPNDGDVFETPYYIYTYIADEEGWSVSVKSKEESQYASVCESIYSKPVVNMNGTFKDCQALTIAPAIPSGVKDMTSAFEGCTALSGTISVYANPEQYENLFAGTAQAITLTGSSSVLTELSATSSLGNVVIE